MDPSHYVRLVLLAVVLLSLLPLHEALIHDLTISNDRRKHFFIENFGFVMGGRMAMKITNFKKGKELTVPPHEQAAFLIKVTVTDSTAFLEETSDVGGCILKDLMDEDTIHVYIENANLTEYNKEIESVGQEGFYNIYFINCLGEAVSFHLHMENYNVYAGNKISYLSAGDAQLPTIFGIFTIVYCFLIVVWLYGFMRGPDKKVNRMHHLMTILLTLKALALLFQAVELHFIKIKGYPGGWEVTYYIFAILKTVMFFVLVALIGTGWTFVKPFLSDKDKKIIMVVIPLQILDNVAMVIMDETAPGSQGWVTWKDIFKVVDIICCGAVLIPIIWSIKHLREASQIDGKAARNLQKLKLFRLFYLVVVSYIYFTRIIIYLLDATLPFKLVWIGDMFSELAALCFFCVVGYKFSPAEDNPYFKIDEDDDAVRLEQMARGENQDD